jgi:hypothetical protein
VISDFDETDTAGIRSLFTQPVQLAEMTSSLPLKASTESLDTVRLGGVPTSKKTSTTSKIAAVGGVSKKLQHTLDDSIVDTHEGLDSFDRNQDRDAQVADQENSHALVRPLRLFSVGQEEKNQHIHKNFLKVADLQNYKVIALQPCPKDPKSQAGKRYISSMSGSTIKQLKELGSTTADIEWNFARGYLTFPGHESSRDGHVFNADIHMPHHKRIAYDDAKNYKRSGAFEQALITIDEELTNKELNELLGDRIRMIKFGEKHGHQLLSMSVKTTPPTTANYIDWHISPEPEHYKHTLEEVCPEHAEWKDAMDEELLSMRRFEVYEQVSINKIPKGRQVLGCKWVYKRKRDQHGNIVKYRSRVVALGFRQRPYDSFIPEETYSPVVSKDSLRLFLSICAKQNLTIYQADVKAAFLQAPLKEEIYMQAPPGYREKDEDGFDVIWKLKKAVYGLKQASSCFWNAVNSHLVKLGFHSLTGDPCLFQKSLPNGKKIIVCCYVDDITYAVSDKETGDEFLSSMRDRFFIGKDEGNPIEWLLGMSIQQDLRLGVVHMNMSSMIDKLANLVLTKEERVKSTSIDFPMLPTPLPKLVDREVSVTTFDYLSVVGSLLHLANCVRCDIAFAVGCLARYSMTPGKAHVKAVKRVVQYLYNTKELGIAYYRDNKSNETPNVIQDIQVYENGLHPNDQDKLANNASVTYADSDYAMDYTRKSTMGIVVMLNNGPISWTSVLGKTVATSTCEAEVNAAVSAVKDSLHFKLMMLELGLAKDTDPILLMEDNSACIAQAEGGIHHVRNAKHYEVKLRFLQERVLNKEIKFVYCPTNDQLADFFTKPLDLIKFLGFRNKLMCINPISK